MVKIANVAKAVGVWAGAIYLLYGNDDVASFFAGSRYLPGLAISRSPEGGAVYLGGKGKAAQYGGAEFQKGMAKGLSYGRETTPVDISLSVSPQGGKAVDLKRGASQYMYQGGFS